MSKPVILHPLLFAIFPILSLYSHNIGMVSFHEIYLPIAITCFANIIILVATTAIVKNVKKAGMIVSIALSLFFSYGHASSPLMNIRLQLGKFIVGPNTVLFIIWPAIFIALALLCLRTRMDLIWLTHLLNFMASFLMIILFINIGIYKYTYYSEREKTEEKNFVQNPNGSEQNIDHPNIYYIILDGYGRADVLKSFYEYDNSQFLNDLRRRGFYVADKATSNYMQTYLSVASSLNFIYLADLANEVGEESDNRVPLEKMIANSMVRKFLNAHKYTFIAFSSGFAATDIKNADIYISPPWWSINEFQTLLLQTTPLPALLRKLPVRSPYDLHRERILYILEHLADISKLKGPAFIFAHILAPHPPFVFGEMGEPINRHKDFSIQDGSAFMKNGTQDEYQQDYKRQIMFISKKILWTIDKILKNSSIPPVIILQSDHGPGSMLDFESLEKSNLKERIPILSAYYVPKNPHIVFYDSMTPVNTFRVIFNHYFGANFALLADKNFFSTETHPYKFTDVTEQVNHH